MSKQCLSSPLLGNIRLDNAIALLEFKWTGTPPRAGQFFMIKPRQSPAFLPRPLSVFYHDGDTLRFLVAPHGAATASLARMQTGNEAELIGPLGNCWSDFIKGGERPLALIGGGIGIAPLVALAQELRDSFPYDFYAGFKSVSPKLSELLTALLPRLIIATEDGMEGGGRKGRIPDFLNPAAYRAVFACGPAAMLTAVTAQCQSVPCFVSTERRMACGVGACLGCAIETRGGYKHCCSDGPIFNAEELVFES